MSGKSHFILELLKNRSLYFNPVPVRVAYAYGIWQTAFDNIDGIEFVKNIEGLAGVEFNSSQPSILIVDDLMKELCNNKELSTLFTREMHHKNATVFFRLQNLYVALNCQLLILFKPPRDTEQIKVLAEIENKRLG